MSKEHIVEIPKGSDNRYKYEYKDGATVYRGPVGSAPTLSEEEFLTATHANKPMRIDKAWNLLSEEERKRMWYVSGKERVRPGLLAPWKHINKWDKKEMRGKMDLMEIKLTSEGFKYNLERIERFHGKEFVEKHWGKQGPKITRYRQSYGYMDPEDWDRIRDKPLLKSTPNNVALADDWESVVREGSDEKYGRLMYSRKLDQFRSQTMGEFYGKGIVD